MRAAVMWATSARWKETIVRSHKILARFDFLVDGDVALSVDGSVSGAVQLDGGSVTVAEGVVRRTCTLNVYDRDGLLWPPVDKGLLIPDRVEVRVWAGLRYWDATPLDDANGTAEEWVPVITGPIQTYDGQDYPELVITAADRMSWVQRRFSTPYTIPGGLTIDDAAFAILAAKVPPGALVVNLPATVETTTVQILDADSDPADKLRELGTGVGWTIVADQMGNFVDAGEPEPTADNVDADYSSGPGTALVKAKPAASVETLVNTWVVTGESSRSDTGGVPFGIARDDNPASPTYVRGSYDEGVQRVNLPVIKTDAAATAAAQTYRRRGGGFGDVVTATVFPDPSHDKGDVARIASNRVGVDRLIVVDGFVYDLAGAPMDLSARAGFTETVPDA